MVRKELDLLCQTGSMWDECNPAANGEGPCSLAQQLSHTPQDGTTHQLEWSEGGKALTAFLLTQIGPWLTFSTVHSKRVTSPDQLGKGVKTATDKKVSSKKWTPRLQPGHMPCLCN